MTFTDDDLNRVKDYLGTPTYLDVVNCGDIQALIARLEAAEKVCACAEQLEREDHNITALIENVKQWRKAAGK